MSAWIFTRREEAALLMSLPSWRVRQRMGGGGGRTARADSSACSQTSDQKDAAWAQEAARKALDGGIARALAELERRRQACGCSAEHEAALTEAGENLDDLIAAAVQAEVSAKYGKKVRKRLQAALDVLQGKAPPAKDGAEEVFQAKPSINSGAIPTPLYCVRCQLRAPPRRVGRTVRCCCAWFAAVSCRAEASWQGCLRYGSEAGAEGRC